MLANEEVLAPVYYILGGTKSGEVSHNNSYGGKYGKIKYYLLSVFEYWYFRLVMFAVYLQS